MKILFVTKHYRPGAGDRSYMFGLEKRLRRRGHEVGYFAMAYPANLPSPFSRYFVPNVTFGDALHSRNPLKWLKTFLRSFYSPESSSRITRLLQDYRPDVVHIHSLDTHLTYSILPAIRKQNIPVVWTLHTFAPLCISYFLYDRRKGCVCEACRPKRFFMAALKRCGNGSLPASVTGSLIHSFNHTLDLFRFVDVFVCPSRFVRDKFIAFNFRPEKLVWLPNFVDLPEIRPSATGRYGIFLGRIEREKGVYPLLEALQETGIPFKFIGDGSARQDLVRKARGMGLQDVEFTGYKTGDELKDLISGAMFCVVPSLVYEVGPLAVLDAFSFAKPVIGFKIGGIPEMVRNDETGYILDDFSPRALRQKMLFLYRHPEKAALMGQRARRYVTATHDAERHCDRILRIYGRFSARASA